MARGNKFHARKCSEDGYVFDSLDERERYRELKLLERGGHIIEIEVHPKFDLLAGYRDNDGKKIRDITYSADFRYVDLETGFIVIEDVKSKETAKLDAFSVRWKWAKWLNPTFKFRIVMMAPKPKRARARR